LHCISHDIERAADNKLSFLKANARGFSQGVFVSGGDGEGLKSICSKYCNLSGLLVQFLDQLTKLGETAGKLKNFENTGS
jgi:hypothetical protein